jgi:zinc transport system permease protein
LDFLQYSFMQKAFLVGILIGTLCPTIGTFLVLRRLSMVGDTLAHVSLSGVLLGFLWNISPLPFAVFLAVLVSLSLEKLRSLFRHYAELSLSIIMAAGLGTAVILIGLTNSTEAGLSSILFGSIITLNSREVVLISLLSLVTYILVIRYYREFLYLTFDEDGARLAGIKVSFFSNLLVFLAAIVVALGLRIVGALLVSSLMVVPVAAGLLLEKSFKETLIWANILGLISVLSGLVASFYLDLAPGGTIVIASIILLLIILAARSMKMRVS